MENKFSTLIEAMIPARYSNQHGSYDLRCWREEQSWTEETIKNNREEIMKHLTTLKGTESVYEIGMHVLSLDRMNSVEVLYFIPKGNGICLHKNWP